MDARTRGTLRVLLGAAPGCGKTFAMLREGGERRHQGEDVVVGFVEAHNRPLTINAVGSLEVVPRLVVEYRGKTLEDMDVDAVVARAPQVALVDELAHTNASGMRNEKRWQDVEELRDNGINVITTVNVQHVESVKDVVEHIAGVPVRETIPDSVLDGADEIQFIDISPEALRKRMRHGNIYAPEKVDTALMNFFRPGNLAALREIALRLVAQSVGAARGIRAPAQDVLVAVSGRPASEDLVRRGARIARRYGGMCTIVTAHRAGQPPDAAGMERVRALAAQLECQQVELEGPVADVVIDVATGLGVGHVVVGEEAEPHGFTRLRAGLVERVIQALPDVNVHVLARVAHGHEAPPVMERPRPDADALLKAITPPTTRRGLLRIHLGYASGCGTTTAMLDEACRRTSRGTDVVVAAVRTCGRATGEAALARLNVLGGRASPAVEGRLDTAALLRRNPEVACIDDLAGETVAGGRIVDDVARVLTAGIHIIATLTLADLRSVRDGLGTLLGPSVRTRPPVDDAILTLADEVELVDVTPSVLDERLRRLEILPAAEVARALQGEFRPDVLAALRETAFRVIAGHTDRRLVDYMHDKHIDQPWEAKTRVMLCVPARAGMESVIRRAAKMARRLDADFTAVTVRNRERSDAEKMHLGAYAALTHQLGGQFTTLYERKVAPALAAHAQRILATEIVVTRGDGGRGRHGTLGQLVRLLNNVDIHVLSTSEEQRAPARDPVTAAARQREPVES
ncbi:MAG TPA: hypothetical protein VFO60_06205 [Candidatus Dormibacteraeota bacterium]|nr:hypothetical protein [Candidatus Dormibacteraeota bacterium]